MNLASASGTIVLGYNVRPDPAARRLADSEGVEIRTYSIIMEMLDDVKAAMAGLLPPVVTESMLGRAEISGLIEERGSVEVRCELLVDTEKSSLGSFKSLYR